MVLTPMSPSSVWRLVFLFIALGFLAPAAYSQAALGNTTLGKSQNSSQDLVNSLIPGPEKYGKNEKKAEVDPKTLQSKKSHDATFSGGMNDIGLDWSSNSMGKPHTSAAADADSKKSKPSDAEEKKATAGKVADTAEKKSGDTTNDAAEKDQKKIAAKSDEKSSEKSAKSDGDH
jgi:hypothetical protein